ncbi:pentatricopeptide repeat-containing protein At1g11290, chloroplastic-like [Tasmannia lanceolata]|uniref:pentatricopeptide repeat-containing protein At1g11290, chloroplastic-like n=1 Tax=Tasmannia lanceolata TaxID=3420 RepID=UPI00406372E5
MGSATALLNLYSQQGKWRELISLYHQMRKDGFQPNTFTFPILLKSSSSTTNPHFLAQGQSIHADATKRGFESDAYVTNALLSMYAQCGSLNNALQLFDEIPEPGPVSWNVAISSFFHTGDWEGASRLFEQMPEPNVVTWSAMIAGYTQNGRASDALRVFNRMRRESNYVDNAALCFSPNSNTIASVLSACVQLRDLSYGEQVHGYTRKISTYIESDVYVGSVLIDMYGRCSCPALARGVFDSMREKSVVAWSVLIAIYVQNECPSIAFEVLREMVYRGGKPNYVTLTTLITACTNITNLRVGKELHCFIARRQLELDAFISTALIGMYGKCNCMVYARRVFKKEDNFLWRNTATMWNALVVGYVENDCIDDAWSIVRAMTQLSCGGAKPNAVTMAIVLPMCARSSLLLYGKEIHCYALKNDLDKEILVGNALLDMYSKCGMIWWAGKQFDRMSKKNRISWTSMIDGYGIHGDGEAAIRIFQRMVREKDIEPDHVTFVALISACSHAGLVEEGVKYFKAMKEEYGVMPMEENYGSVVDLLARAGRINEAKDLIVTMHIKPSASVWGALLAACRIHGNVDEAEIVVQHLHELEPKEAGFQTLLSNIYAETGQINNVEKVRRAMSERRVVKRRGCSWLETKEGIHGFVVGNISQLHDNRDRWNFNNHEVEGIG